MKAASIGALMALLCLWHEAEALPPKFGMQGMQTLTADDSMLVPYKTKRGSCSCSTSGTQTTCSCCQKIVGMNTCMELTIMISGVNVQLKVAGAKILDEDLIGATGPGDFCVGKAGFTLCFDFYNVDLTDLTDPSLCVKVTASTFFGKIASVNLGCI